MKLSRLLISVYVLMILFSCKQELKPFAIKQEDLCKYFYLQTDTVEINGKMRTIFSPEIHKNINDAAGIFFAKYPKRFDYLLNKELEGLLYLKRSDRIDLQPEYCRLLKTGSFYNNVALLLPQRSPKLSFSKNEMMLVASRFFNCDTILKKGDKIGVGWHICVGINGLGEIKSDRDLDALEALCFEAINTAMLKKIKPVFYRKFIFYVNETNKKEKPFYKDDKSHLEKVRQQCFQLMQNDMALQESLLSYFEKHKQTLGFEIR